MPCWSYAPHPSFFSLPDTNSDGVLDEQELEALFTKEVSTWWGGGKSRVGLSPFTLL